MSKALRTLAPVVAVLAMAAAPCAPAWAGGPACPMAGCDDAPVGAIGPPCCCAPSGVPAEAGSSGALAGPAPATHAPAPAASISHDAHPQAAGDTFAEPALHVPLFLLHGSLLR
jgi:hypothetical protein